MDFSTHIHNVTQFVEHTQPLPKELQAELSGIRTELRNLGDVMRKKEEISELQFAQKVLKFVRDSVGPSFRSGDVPFPGHDNSSVPDTVEECAKQLEKVLFFFLYTQKGLENAPKIMAFRLMGDYLRGEQVPPNISDLYMINNRTMAFRVVQTIIAFATKYKVASTGLTALLGWCETITRGVEQSMDPDRF